MKIGHRNEIVRKGKRKRRVGRPNELEKCIYTRVSSGDVSGEVKRPMMLLKVKKIQRGWIG